MKGYLRRTFDRVTLVGKRFRRHDAAIEELRTQLYSLAAAVRNNPWHVEANETSRMQALLTPLIRSTDRLALGDILNFGGLTGEGAEIGVRHADFSFEILSKWRGSKLYSIDPWVHWLDPEYDISLDPANVGQKEQDEIFAQAQRRLSMFGNRSEIVRKTSADAVQLFDDEQLDFAYIDAQHHYQAVREDLALWWPKVKPGGLLVGDDYSQGWPGVITAVDEFCAQHGRTIEMLGRNNFVVFK